MTTDDSPPVSQTPPSVWPYVIPLIGFLVLTTLEGYLPKSAEGFPSPVWYPWAYAAKVVAVSALVWYCRSTLKDLLPRPTLGAIALAVVVGLAVTGAWVGLDGRYPELTFLGKRTAFDPSTIGPIGRYLFLAVRMLGLVALVPLIEELFYRSFLMRWIIDPDYTRVPIGTVTPLALGVTTGVFAFSHPEWLPALLTGLAWGWLVKQTQSVSACVISHATANLGLGIYVLMTGEWKYW